ncbi:S-layer homology domain-containing protein [Alkalihalobacillus oceani]|uniref:S-layer homology domain-containing protein n=1 Tax=Halalkalibacter oceani TaxID=1653776 RepID=UPI00204191A3|nr:S-layer homology domain-containing protein [Halalkalibacter oceani]MCM3760933.1 S-layer homology domain-containing protein [Halalkalibacter oceani]
MKHFLAILLILSAVFFQVGTSVVAADDLTGHSLEAEMREAVTRGIMAGYGNGHYGPDDAVTRAQFATFLARALELPSGEASFSDVPASHPLAGGIGRASKAGIVGGYPGNVFRPEENISREQMAVMIDRALEYKRVQRTPIALTFTDTEQIHPSFRTAVAHNAYFGIIQGMPQGNQRFRFGPKDDATRAHAAAFMIRMLKVAETGTGNTELYHVGTVDSGGQVRLQPEPYMSYRDAEQAGAEVIVKGEKILKMQSGMVAATPSAGESTTRIFAANKTTQLTYVMGGAELEYISSDEEWVEVRYADSTGFVRQRDARLIPSGLMQGRSYYQPVNGVLRHYVYNPLTNATGMYYYGDAPSFMQENERYYSRNGRDFYHASGQKAGEAYQYFNYLPLRTKTNYTAEDLNRYIRSVTTEINGKVVAQESPLRNLGHVFKQAEERYGINALYLFAKAIHESSYGLSEIANQRKNLFGYQAYDRDPLGNAKPFNSFEESIMFVAEAMDERYLTPAGVNYRGAVLGNKSHGMNVNYASDPFWGQKIAGHMYRADTYLGKKDYGHYTIARTTEALNVRPQPNTGLAAQYQYPGASYFVALLESTNQSDGTWYRIYSDHKDHEFGYVHGNYVQPVPIMKR